MNFHLVDYLERETKLPIKAGVSEKARSKLLSDFIHRLLFEVPRGSRQSVVFTVQQYPDSKGNGFLLKTRTPQGSCQQLISPGGG